MEMMRLLILLLGVLLLSDALCFAAAIHGLGYSRVLVGPLRVFAALSAEALRHVKGKTLFCLQQRSLSPP